MMILYVCVYNNFAIHSSHTCQVQSKNVSTVAPLVIHYNLLHPLHCVVEEIGSEFRDLI
jgi:hypothetical protein